MKKYIALLLALVIMLGAFSACAHNKGAKESEAESAVPAINPDESEAPAEEEQVEESGISLGEISNGTVYTNSFAGITLTVPENWSFVSEDELMHMLNLGYDFYDKDKQSLNEYLQEHPLYDMMASSDDGSESITVSFENTVLYPQGESLTLDDYLDALEEKFEELWDTGARSDVKLGAVDYRCLSVQYKGIDIYEEVYVRREGEFVICIILMRIGESTSINLGECFS